MDGGAGADLRLIQLECGADPTSVNGGSLDHAERQLGSVSTRNSRNSARLLDCDEYIAHLEDPNHQDVDGLNVDKILIGRRFIAPSGTRLWLRGLIVGWPPPKLEGLDR